jgi:hypothetical protein
VLRVEPPLTIREEHLDRFVAALDQTLSLGLWGLARRVLSARLLGSGTCTPNDLARAPGGALSERSASRGAVRMPLPVRSKNTTAASPDAAPRDTNHRSRPPVQPVDHAEVKRRQIEAVDHVKRQDDGHHFGRHVGHQTGEPQEQHVPSHRARKATGTRLPPRAQELRHRAGLVHGNSENRARNLTYGAAPVTDNGVTVR